MDAISQMPMARRRAGGINWRGGLRPAVYWLGLVPAVWTFYLALTDQLGADPMKALEHGLGLWALRFLVAGLAISPLRRLGGPNLVPYRRAVGLLAFFYAALHVLVYVALDQSGDLSAIGRDIVKRPYIIAGLAAFTLLVPLAVTSHNAMIRRMGALTWRRLHRAVYVAAAAAALHFILVVKAWPPEPLVYAGLVAVLLAFRGAVYTRKRLPR